MLMKKKSFTIYLDIFTIEKKSFFFSISFKKKKKNKTNIIEGSLIDN